jgi:flavodoxin
MNSLVIYASHSGNTRWIAGAIAAALERHGRVDLVEATEVVALPAAIDLVFVGGPTEGHGMTEEIKSIFDRLPKGTFAGLRAATFDTRVHWPKLLSGSAAVKIADRLQADGARMIAEPESFIVTMKPELEPCEEQRAAAWAASLSERVAASTGVRQLAGSARGR